jgi:hypothetical protein
MTINDAVRVVGSLDLEWSDKPTIEDIQADTDVEIDAISMLPEDPEQEVARYNAILQLAVQAITDPNVANKIAQEGKTINIAPLIQKILQRSRIHDPDIFRNITQEESMGFVSVAEIRAAEANVNAIMQGQELPSPPAPEQDHKARIEVYRAAAIVAASSGNEQLAQVLQQLIQVQAQIMEEEDTEAKPGRPVGS